MKELKSQVTALPTHKPQALRSHVQVWPSDRHQMAGPEGDMGACQSPPNTA